MTVKISAQSRQCPAAVRHACPGNTMARPKRIAHYSDRAIRNCLVDVPVPVCMLTAHGYEAPARLHSPAVVVETDDGRMRVRSVHPGVTVNDVLANTGWELKVPGDMKPTPEPNAAELKAIREYDTKGFWTS